MFSKKSLVVDPDGFFDATADHLARLLSDLTQQPGNARKHRSCLVISFEKLGVHNPASDPRAAAFLRRLHESCPGLGYFLHGDPPGYCLRDVSMALAVAMTDGKASVSDFSRTHWRLHERGAAFGASVFDKAHALDEIFAVNLLPMLMTPTIRRRAMKALLPALLLAVDAQDQLKDLCVREAEALWGRKLAGFSSFAAFVGEYQRSLQEAP